MTEHRLNDLAEALREHAPSFKGVVSVIRLETNAYADGNPGLGATLEWDDGFVENMQLSVNLRQYGMIPPRGFYYIRDYSEYVGVADALEAADIVTKAERVSFGYGKGWLVKLNGEWVTQR